MGRRVEQQPDSADRNARFYAQVWPHAADVLRTARMLTGDAAEADDLAQETLLKAFKALDSFRSGSDMRAWLMAILRNTRIDRLRSAASSQGQVSLDQLPDDPAGNQAGDEEAWGDAAEVLQQFSDQQVIAALQGLPEEIRWTLLLVDVQGMDQADAAAVLDVPVGTIKSRCHRGRAMLRQALLPVGRDLGFLPRRKNPASE